jgi:hypothetical protein
MVHGAHALAEIGQTHSLVHGKSLLAAESSALRL